MLINYTLLEDEKETGVQTMESQLHGRLNEVG